jgi:NodT family efflux transporter outer membrane factor (OMF) lipoprotein
MNVLGFQAILPRAVGVLGSLLMLGACASFKESSTDKPIDPASISMTSADAAISWPTDRWWETFGDEQLSHLIEQAQADHPTMRIIEARVRRAAATERLAIARTRPDLSFNAEVTRERYSENYIYPPPMGGSSETSVDLGLDFSYEFDLWGKQRAELEAARLAREAASVDAALAKQYIATAVAKSYFSLQLAYEELDIAQQDLAQRQDVAKLLEARVQRGFDTDAELELQRANVASAKQAIIVAEATIETDKHQLAFLVAQGPQSLQALNAPRVALPAPIALPEQLPIDLLSRRPDVVGMRLRMEAASSGVDAAKATFFPNIDLRAFFGLQAIGLDHVLELGSRDYGLGPALHLPILNRGALRANLQRRYADFDMAVAQYNAVVLYAVQEVADQGTTLKSVGDQRAMIEERLQALHRAREVNMSRYRRGLSNYLTVLNADSALLVAQRNAAELRDRELQASLTMIRALGGGYVAPSTTSK